MKKRFLSILLTLCMVLVLLPTPVFAADSNYQVTTAAGTVTSYDRFSDALTAAQENNGSTLKCFADVNDTDIAINKGNFTIDANGKTFTSAISVGSGATVTIDGNGTFNIIVGRSIIDVSGTLNIKSGTFYETYFNGQVWQFSGLVQAEYGTINIFGGDFNQVNASGNGTISGGKFQLMNVAGNVRLSGGKYKRLKVYAGNTNSLSAYLADGYGIKYKGSWADVSATSIGSQSDDDYYVEVVEPPIQDFDLQLTETGDGKLTVEVQNLAFSSEEYEDSQDLRYQYKVDDGSWSASTSDTAYTFAPGSAGNHTVSVKATLYLDCEKSLDYYVIGYQSEDGEGSIPSGVKFDGVDFTLSSNTFTRTGYTQTGWATSDGGEKVYDLGGEYTADTAVTLYPVWTINQYTITVKPKNGGDDIPIKQDYGTPVTAPTLTRDGYAFDGWDKTFPTTMPAEDMTITAKWKDITAPTGEIKLGNNGWKTFLNNITFGLFFKDTQEITITATDNDGEDVKIEYLLSDKELTAEELATATFTAYSDKFTVEPNNEYVIYAKLTDKSDNVAYINSNGIVLDNVAPVISGITNGETYCAAQTVTVSDKYDVTVTVNGTPITLDANGQFTLSPASGTQTVVAKDQAGNVSAEMIVTVNGGHEGGTATCTKKAECKHCGNEYGEVDVTNHTTLKHIGAKAATTEAEGNIEYWHCEDCNKYFSDKDGKNEIALAETVIAKLSDSKAPQTGDNSRMALWFALLFVSGGALIGTTVYGKKKKYFAK